MNRAITVREKITKLVKLLTEKSVCVTQRGNKAYVECAPNGCPKIVNIPYIADDASDEFLDAIEGYVDHEVAHVLFTDYKVLAKAKKLGVARLHNIIEDSFIERMMASRFAGSAANLRNTGGFFLKTYTDKKLAEEPDNAVAYLMVSAIRAWAGQTVYADYMKDKWEMMPDVVKRIGTFAAEALPKIASSQDGLDAALKIKELLELPKEKPTEGEGGKGEPAKKTPKTGEDTKDDTGEKKEDTEGDEGGPEPDDEGDAPGDDPAEEEPEPESEGESEPGSSGDAESEGESESGDSDEGFKVSDLDSVADYDDALADSLSEKSIEEGRLSDYLVYTKELDIIEPAPSVSSSGASADILLQRLQESVDHLIGPLQKDLERAIAARSAAVWSHGHRSGRLHSSALARLTTTGDPRAFKRKHESTTKDVAVSLLIDCSGSMGSMGKIRLAAEAAYGLAMTLDRMGVKLEVLGFTTKGLFDSDARKSERELGKGYARDQPLYIPIFKSFDERMDTENKKRLAVLQGGGYLWENVDGESVQIAATRLLGQRETRKILMVFSDGQPACPGDYMAQRRHLKNVVKGVEKAGIDVLGIGIMDDSAKQYYPKHVLLKNVSELPSRVIGEIKRLLLQA